MAGTEQTINPLPPAGETFFTTLLTFLQQEDADRFELIFDGFVVTGGLHGPTAGLVGTPSPLVAFTNGFYTVETGSITYPDNDTIFVIANNTLVGNSGTYIRVPGTHYLIDAASASEPALPSGAIRLMTVVTFGGAITAVTDRRSLTPIALPLQLGGLPNGGQRPGPFSVLVQTSDNSPDSGTQCILAQMVNGDPHGVGLVTLGNDKVAISGWSFRGAPGGGSPLYGANFGVVFDSPGVANGTEIDVQNNSGVDGHGQGLWVNGSGTNHRSNAILIDTQDTSKWSNGIKFQSFLGGGATGNVTFAGILFEGNQSQNHILIRPYDDLNPSNNVFELRDSFFSFPVRAGIQKRGAFAGFGGATDVNNPTFTFTDDPRTGMFLPALGQLGFSTNGFPRMVIDQGVRVGLAVTDQGFGTMNSLFGYWVNDTPVVSARKLGWAAATNTKLKTTFDTTAVTLPQLAARVGALIDDLLAHGLIGA
jgi:hypothetical protein